MINRIILLIVYYLIINITAFTLFGVDKHRAKNRKWRISEFQLFLAAVLGGGIGAMLGMRFFKHKTKRIKFKLFIPILTVASLFVFSVPLVSWYVVSIGEKYVVDMEHVENGDAILVLGAYVNPNGTVSDILKDRLDSSVKLYEQKAAPKIIVSGDHGTKEYDEVNAMRKYLIDKGVPSEDIFMDHAGFDTYHSMYRARDVFCVSKPIVVSQRYHIIRASYIGRMLGMDVVGIGADTHRYARMSYYELREYASRYKAFFECLIKRKPKYLGETIPVSGDGNDTLD